MDKVVEHEVRAPPGSHKLVEAPTNSVDVAVDFEITTFHPPRPNGLCLPMPMRPARRTEKEEELQWPSNTLNRCGETL